MRKAHTRALVWLAVLLTCSASASALDPSLDVSQYAHTAWKVRDGFISGTIHCIAQTPDGYLWLGTESGLYRFDGVRAVLWQPPAGEHLPGNFIQSLLVSRDGTLWIGTFGGLASWKNGKLTKYPEVAGRSIAVADLLEDRDGTVWIGTFGVSDGKICAFKASKIRCYGAGVFGPGIVALYEDRKGDLWVSARTGLWRWAPGTPERYEFPRGVAYANSLIEDGNGALLLATDAGLKQLAGGKIQDYRLPTISAPFTPSRFLRSSDKSLWITTREGLLHLHRGRAEMFSSIDGLSGDVPYIIFEDRENNIWVSTENGLDRFHDFPIPTISRRQGLFAVDAVQAAPDGSIWITSGNGVNRWANSELTLFRDSTDLGERLRAAERDGEHVTKITNSGLQGRAYSLGLDGQRIWASTSEGIFYFDVGRFVRVPGIPGGVVLIASDGHENVWIANTYAALFYRTPTGSVQEIPWSRFPQKFARTLLPDPLRGGLWIGFLEGGIAYLEDGQVRASYSAVNGLGDGRVTHLRFGPDGALWVATESGLSRIKDGHISTLTSLNGLPCSEVHWSMEDDDHAVWLYMPCALVRIEASELDAWVNDPKHVVKTAVFDSSDGVRKVGVYGTIGPLVTKSRDGRIWFVLVDGVSVIDPRHLAFNNLPPPVHIEQVVADGNSYWQNVSGDASASHPRLPPLVHDLQIDYTALSLVAPEKLRFRYKLEGLDSDWLDVGNRRQAFYTNLPPRNYRFRVIASNNSGVWNDTGAFLDFAIAPAYYQTNWFRALCVAALLGVLWALYQLRIRRVRREERKLRDVVETIPTIAWTALPDGWVDFSNHHWEEYTGLSLEKGAGSGWEAAVHPDDVKRHAEKWRASVASGEPFENEARYRGTDGNYRWFLVRAVPLRDGGGKILKWYGTKTDIEDRKRAEQLQADFAHVSRVSMMGELSASLAHEIKQPIAATVVNADACLQFLKHEKPDLEDVREAASGILAAAMRAGNIIDRLQSLYKKSPPKRELVDVNEIVQEMVPLLRSEAHRYAVSIRTDLAASVPNLEADRVQLQQVLMNLMLNAIEAMKETGGVLTVKSQAGEDGKLLISVSDTGVGLPAEKADQIFDAFFTTKPQGSGMGLAISRSIIESHGGRLWATANDGRGATFHFTLPIADEQVKVPASGRDSVPIRTSNDEED